MAQGEVACASIDAKTMKLTACPADLAQRLMTPMTEAAHEARVAA